jgi:dTDP-4-dehydrorhamnose 3,5-epimerase
MVGHSGQSLVRKVVQLESVEDLLQGDSLIEGVCWKPLVSHNDSRGFFREVIRHTDPLFSGPFGQWSHSKMAADTVKAWHFHHRQTDWWYVPLGSVEVLLVDARDESPTFGTKVVTVLGDNPGALSAVVKIPPGVLHGCKVQSESAHLFYITSHTYDPQDEGRIAYNSPTVGHDWGGGELIVAERDRSDFMPLYMREPLSW